MFHMIYLAAGYSTRFGSNKLLYELDGKPMFRHLLDRLDEIAEEGNIEADITVVTQYPEIGEAREGREGLVAFNEDPSRGISSSLITGIRALEERQLIREGDYLVFFTADQPYLRKETVEDFFTSVEYMGRGLAAMGYEDRLLSPCAFEASYLPELLALTGDRGGKRILLEHMNEVYLFRVDSPEELADLDML